MTQALTLPQARIALGWATIKGERIPVEIDQEWMRALLVLVNRTGGVMGNDDFGMDVMAFGGDASGVGGGLSFQDLIAPSSSDAQQPPDVVQPASSSVALPDVVQPASSSVASDVHSAPSKTTPVDADEIPLTDSATSFTLNKLTWANVKAALATWLNAGLISATLTKLKLSPGYSTSALGTVAADTALQLYVSGNDAYGMTTNAAGGLDIMANQAGQSIRLYAGTNNLAPTKVADFSAGQLAVPGTLATLGGAVMHITSSALTNGAGAAAGTLLTAPVAGNPTKWIGINDNGTTRYIPAW